MPAIKPPVTIGRTSQRVGSSHPCEWRNATTGKKNQRDANANLMRKFTVCPPLEVQMLDFLLPPFPPKVERKQFPSRNESQLLRLTWQWLCPFLNGLHRC